jgi:hypothetical protein
MAFIRRKEDFACEHCGTHVEGSGYTNHCPKCLWSKHVDNDPGDRAAECGGMMRPISIEGSSPDYRIVHRCERCGMIRKVNVATGDEPQALIALSGKTAII